MTCSRYTAVTVNGRKRSKQIIRKKERERAMRRENSLEVQDIRVIRSGRKTVSLQIDKDIGITQVDKPAMNATPVEGTPLSGNL